MSSRYRKLLGENDIKIVIVGKVRIKFIWGVLEAIGL